MLQVEDARTCDTKPEDKRDENLGVVEIQNEGRGRQKDEAELQKSLRSVLYRSRLGSMLGGNDSWYDLIWFALPCPAWLDFPLILMRASFMANGSIGLRCDRALSLLLCHPSPMDFWLLGRLWNQGWVPALLTVIAFRDQIACHNKCENRHHFVRTRNMSHDYNFWAVRHYRISYAFAHLFAIEGSIRLTRNRWSYCRVYTWTVSPSWQSLLAQVGTEPLWIDHVLQYSQGWPCLHDWYQLFFDRDIKANSMTKASYRELPLLLSSVTFQPVRTNRLCSALRLSRSSTILLAPFNNRLTWLEGAFSMEQRLQHESCCRCVTVIEL